MADNEERTNTGAYSAQQGGISGDMLRMIATVITIVGVIVGGAMALGRLDASIAEFRQQYNRDSAETRADLRSALTQLVELKQRVTVLETQRSADERALEGRMSALEQTVREMRAERDDRMRVLPRR